MGAVKVDDQPTHAKLLASQLARAAKEAEADEPGFDDRWLLRIAMKDRPPEALAKMPGVELVSEEGRDEDGRKVAVVFSTREARDEFEARLAMLAGGETVSDADVLLAVKGIDNWGPADRMTAAFVPVWEEWQALGEGRKRLDVELFFLDSDSAAHRQQMIRTFEQRCEARKVRILDRVTQAIVLLRVEADIAGVRWLLRYRDVRSVDVPPRFQLVRAVHALSARDLDVRTVAADAPRIAVLDSGVRQSHPLLQEPVIHTESFRPGEDAEDENGHGTMVAAIAAYGDIQACVDARRFEPAAALLSGRVLDANNEYDDLIEHQVRRAVTEFRNEYGCRIFNLALADAEHPYDGGRLRSFAATLDDIAREHGVLFVVATGNFEGTASGPSDWRGEYPRYLFGSDARVLDPAPALNVLTVGSIARLELTRVAGSNPSDPAQQPIARRDQPSPFTRTGPGLGDAIKPELVEHGGNYAIDARVTTPRPHGAVDLGVLTANPDFVTGSLFTQQSGTSFAVPSVANMVARVWSAFPNAGPDLIRAMVVAHARMPGAAAELLPEQEELLRAVGYGVPEFDRTRFSNDRSVTLFRQDQIEQNTSHFYEIPLPADFRGGVARRGRRIRVVVAHTPMTRATRIDYRAARLKLRIVKAANFAAVEKVFKQTSRKDREKAIKEPSGIWPSPRVRDAGTVQVATWDIEQVNKKWAGTSVFAVVDLVVPAWAESRVESEPYAIVVIVEDRGEAEVQYYAQLRPQQRVRVRT